MSHMPSMAKIAAGLIFDRLYLHLSVPFYTILIGILLMIPVSVHAKSDVTTMRLYGKYCSVCHGEQGDGKTHARQGLNPPPLDFTAPGIRHSLTRERMIHVITNGKPGTAMAAWKTQLDAGQIEAISDYIRKNFMSEPQLAQDHGGAKMVKTVPVHNGEEPL